MGDKSNEMPKTDVSRWGLKIAKTRNWTDEEVTHAVAHMKQNRPDACAELERLERTTGDLTGSSAADIEFGALANLHPECEGSEITDLFVQVRLHRRAKLGLR